MTNMGYERGDVGGICEEEKYGFWQQCVGRIGGSDILNAATLREGYPRLSTIHGFAWLHETFAFAFGSELGAELALSSDWAHFIPVSSLLCSGF